MNNHLPFSTRTSRPQASHCKFLRHATSVTGLILGLGIAQTAPALSAATSHLDSHPNSHPFLLEYVSMNTAHFCGPGLLCIDAIGSADIPHLGISIGVYQGMLDFSTIDPDTGCGPNPGTVTLTAANGDTLVLTLGGQHCSSAPGAPLGLTSGDYTVSGGTGRFEGATGGGTYRDVNTSQNPDFTGTDTARFEGVLTY